MSGRGEDASGGARGGVFRVHPRNDPKFQGGAHIYR